MKYMVDYPHVFLNLLAYFCQLEDAIFSEENNLKFELFSTQLSEVEKIIQP
jgi:hypothetical protein